MLYIDVPKADLWDEKREMFIKNDTAVTLQLEHSLLSISKWESIHKKPFLDNRPKTIDDTIDYIRCMTLNKNVDPSVYNAIPNSALRKVNEYIDDTMTATFFSDDNKPKTNRRIITAEVIYYWMISFNIPFECQKWHLNRLLTLIKVCNEENHPPKKLSKGEIFARNRALNKQRRAKLNSRG